MVPAHPKEVVVGVAGESNLKEWKTSLQIRPFPSCAGTSSEPYKSQGEQYPHHIASLEQQCMTRSKTPKGRTALPADPAVSVGGLMQRLEKNSNINSELNGMVRVRRKVREV